MREHCLDIDRIQRSLDAASAVLPCLLIFICRFSLLIAERLISAEKLNDDYVNTFGTEIASMRRFTVSAALASKWSAC